MKSRLIPSSQVMLRVIVSSRWGSLCRDKMAGILQTTLSTAFSWMKMLEFQLKFHWSLFLRIQLTILKHWFRQWLGTDQAPSHYLNKWWLDYGCKYVSLRKEIFSNIPRTGLKKHEILPLDPVSNILDLVSCCGSHRVPEQPWNYI